VEGRVGLPRGYVKVGENEVPGTRLRLHSDLGIDLSETAALQVGYHLTEKDTVRFSFLRLFFDGTTTLPQDVLFNGATLLGGTHLDTTPEFYRATLAYERTLLPLPGGGALFGSAGLTYVYLNFVLHGTERRAVGGEKQPEDFWRQELPVPLLGLRADYPLTPRLGLTASLIGGYLPWVNSLRSEGGEVKLTQGHLDGALDLRYRLTSNLTVSAGYRYTYFMQFEQSREDDNRIKLWEHALALGLALRF
jgi:hypothetical protein